MKKIISLIMTVVLLFTLFIPASAQQNDYADYDGSPLVIVRGIDFAGLHYEDGTPAIGVSATDALSYILNVIYGTFIEKDRNAFKAETLDLVGKIFYGISADYDGKSINDVFIDKYDGSLAEFTDFISQAPDDGETGLAKTAVDKIGAENVFYFTYDWRKSAKELSDELDVFIDNALEKTGKEKADIVAVSMGGMVSSAYLYYHGNSKVNNLTYVSSAHNGTYSCGDALGGNIYFDSDVMLNHIQSASDSPIYGIMVKILELTGLVDITASLVNSFAEKNTELLYNGVFRNTFGTALGFWAMCPDDVFDSAVSFVFDGHENEYPVLLEKIAETREFVFSTESIIDTAIADGVNIAFTSNYGSALSPVSKHCNQQGDGVLETSLTSNFAVTSKIGQTLTEEQIAQADPMYLSPDKTVDATTAVYKDVTWFIRDARHVETIYGSEFSDFILWLTLSDGPLTVTSDARYPQFMRVDSESKLICDK